VGGEDRVSADGSPTARALTTLDLMQGNPGITADGLAERLGVSPRAVRRYVAILREAGIPVESATGPYGGYRVGRGLRMPPLVFTATEALALVMAVLDGHHDPDDASDPAASALDKIVRSLPIAVAGRADAVRRAAAPAPDRGAARPEPATTTALVDAGTRGRAVRIGYRSEARVERALDVDPWAVVVRHGRWYLLFRSHSANAVRTYRVDRISSVELLEATFAPPADLDPVAVLEENLAVGWEYAADVVLHAPADDVREWVPRALGRLEPCGDGTTRLLGSTGNPWWYAARLVELPMGYEVAGGAELRHAVRVLGERMVAGAHGRVQPPKE
jgi:predicted DNA-binding transcriptional regulator YafY